MKLKILFSAIIMLLCSGVVWCVLFANNTKTVVNITQIPQGAYEQIYLDNEGATDEEICRIYANDTVYWNEVDRQMCGK